MSDDAKTRPKVLVVDDDPAILDSLADELGGRYAVTTAESGENALELLSCLEFDAIITDVRMPGIDGIELIRRAEQLNREMVRVILTGFSDEAAANAAWRPNGVYKLGKPWGDELEIILRRALEQRDLLRQTLSNLDSQLEARKRAERAVLRLDKMASLGTLTASVAHELRSPLTYLFANFEWLQATLAGLSVVVDTIDEATAGHLDIEAVRQAIGKLRRDGVMQEIGDVCLECTGGMRRMAEIVDGLRAYAAPVAGRARAVDLVECIGHAVRIARTDCKEGVAIHLDIAEDVPQVIGHEGEYTQVLTNLLLNAIQAMRSRGEIRLRASQQDDRVLVEVSDTGPGVPEEVAARIFDPFFTTKAEADGTGLGLAISRGIAQRYGGTLRLAANSSSGATFALNLPIGTEDGE